MVLRLVDWALRGSGQEERCSDGENVQFTSECGFKSNVVAAACFFRLPTRLL